MRLIVNYGVFWGIDVANVINDGLTEYKMVKMIMECEYFNGLSQLPASFNGDIVNHCCGYNYYDYFSLILNNLSKNKGIVNYQFGQQEKNTLLTLIQRNHCSKRWLKAVLLNKIVLGKCQVDNDTSQTAILYTQAHH